MQKDFFNSIRQKRPDRNTSVSPGLCCRYPRRALEPRQSTTDHRGKSLLRGRAVFSFPWQRMRPGVLNMRSAIRALIIANTFLESEVNELKKSVSHAYVGGDSPTFRFCTAAITK